MGVGSGGDGWRRVTREKQGWGAEMEFGKECGAELGRMVSGIGLREGTRLVRIGGVEGLEKVRSVSELRSGEPGGFFISAFITSPANKVKEFALAAFVDLGVKDFTDLILEFAFNLDRRRR